MQIKEIYDNLNKVYNFKNQAEWDCSGLNDNRANIKNVLVCLDINATTIDYCIAHDVNLIISHHPLFVEPISAENFLARKYTGLLKKHNISAIYLHTPFDRSEHGMNHQFLRNLGALNVSHSVNSCDYVVGEFVQSLSVHKLSQLISKTYKLDFVKYNTQDKHKLIKTVGFCSGSGSDLIYNLNEQLDAFITGDIKYHTWMDATDLELVMIDINHNIENMFIDIITNHLKMYFNNLQIFNLPSPLQFNIV